MRISSLQIFNIANNGIADANKALVKTQQQLSTGVRVLSPSDDPVAATKILQLTEELNSIDQFNKNIDIAENNLVLEESALGAVNNLVVRMKELAVQAGNTATLSETEYRALSAEVDSRLDELKNLLNTQNPGGDFIFGGYKSSSEPFTGDALNGFSYNGDEGQQGIKISNSTTIKASDSGKAIFVDIPSAQNSVRTYASPANTSNPPAAISVGQVVNQAAFDEFYPKDMVITFNADNFVDPPQKNYTISERNSGKMLVTNQVYSPGNPIEYNGVEFKITGSPASGVPAVPAAQGFGESFAQTFPQDYTAVPETFSVNVAGRTATFTLDGPITNVTDLANMLNNPFNGNAEARDNIGIEISDTGISMPAGLNFTLAGGSANTDSILGLNSSTASTSTNGVRPMPGDRMFADATNKQDILTTFSQLSEAMKGFDGTQDSRDALETVVANTLGNIENIQTSILNTTAELGARFNTIESTRGLNLDSELVINEVLSELRDVDYAEAATRLSTQSLILQAAQSSFLRVSQLNLFSQL